jgi:hypothetical protein
MARRLLFPPAVRRSEAASEAKQAEADPNPVRCVMEALLAVLFLVSFAGGGGGKAGW